MAEEKKGKHEFVFNCNLGKYNSIKISGTKKDIRKLEDAIGPEGWFNLRMRFSQDNGRPFVTIITQEETDNWKKKKQEQSETPAEPKPEPAPWEKYDPVDEPDKRTPF